jgi:hypothetical protein
MYRAKAGYIRDRPVTAPDLSMYEEQEAAPPPAEFTAQTAYEIVQRKVKSANAAVGRYNILQTTGSRFGLVYGV